MTAKTMPKSEPVSDADLFEVTPYCSYIFLIVKLDEDFRENGRHDAATWNALDEEIAGNRELWPSEMTKLRTIIANRKRRGNGGGFKDGV